MSNTHLVAEHIYVTTGPAVSVSHDGQPYINEDFPEGSILAQDKKGLWFKYIVEFRDTDPKCWPSPRKLFRDAWTYISHSPGAPYYDAVVNAPKKLIK